MRGGGNSSPTKCVPIFSLHHNFNFHPAFRCGKRFNWSLKSRIVGLELTGNYTRTSCCNFMCRATFATQFLCFLCSGNPVVSSRPHLMQLKLSFISLIGQMKASFLSIQTSRLSNPGCSGSKCWFLLPGKGCPHDDIKNPRFLVSGKGRDRSKNQNEPMMRLKIVILASLRPSSLPLRP